jgi:hypothetical protein
MKNMNSQTRYQFEVPALVAKIYSKNFCRIVKLVARQRAGSLPCERQMLAVYLLNRKLRGTGYKMIKTKQFLEIHRTN